MKLNPEKTAFGRHETFALRYAWLTKAYQAGPEVFDSDNATVDLGVGKNMVTAIRYWMRACGMLESQRPIYTPLADFIFDEKNGADPYLQDEATIWLIHWKLATNPQLATAWYWFFNHYHKPQFTTQELQTALKDFTKRQIKATPAAATIKNDIAVLTRMYCQSNGTAKTPLEDVLDSPLSLLGLMSQSERGRVFQSQAAARLELPIEIFGYAIAEFMQTLNTSVIPLENLMYSHDQQAAPGAVFRLTETNLTAKLESLIEHYPGPLEINETAGLYQLYTRSSVVPMTYLHNYYHIPYPITIQENPAFGMWHDRQGETSEVLAQIRQQHWTQ